MLKYAILHIGKKDKQTTNTWRIRKVENSKVKLFQAIIIWV